MPRHSMTLSRHQDKLLQTPATLETLGSTSAVPLHRLEAWKAACVSSWIHRHGAACGKKFVSELSCRNRACRTTAEQRQLSLLASCRFQDKPIGNYLPQTPKKTDFGSKLEAKIWSQKWSHFWASPNETIEAGSQKLKLKMASVERDTNCPNPKEMLRRQKKDLPMNVPANPSTDARTTEVYVSIKFHSSTSEAARTLFMRHHAIIKDHTPFFFLYHVGTEEVQSSVSRSILFSEAWIGFNEFPPFPQYQCWYKHKREKSNAPACDQSKRLLVCTTSNIKIPGARGYTSSKDEI